MTFLSRLYIFLAALLGLGAVIAFALGARAEQELLDNLAKNTLPVDQFYANMRNVEDPGFYGVILLACGSVGLLLAMFAVFPSERLRWLLWFGVSLTSVLVWVPVIALTA